ncbi:MAG: hypothetical protein ABIJ00_12145 [Candidatus Eisenbacteria bacterium]
MPPETFITSGPAEGTPTDFRVSLFWYGTDHDGYVDHFLLKTIKDAARADFPGGTDWDSLGDWNRTTARESTFTLLADSCCVGSGSAVSALSPWGIMVRAVDNEGAVSEEPATVFFQASNIIPRVRIVTPVKLPTDFRTVPPHPFVAWEGLDPDGDESKLRYKYMILPEADLSPVYPRLPPLDRVKPNEPAGSHAAAPIGYWSEWVPADCTYVWDLDLTAYRATGEPIMVYVTVKDEANAYLPEQIYGSYNNGMNWLRLLVVRTATGVTCVIDGDYLGTRMSNNPGDNRTRFTNIFEGSEISFEFWGKENKWRGEVVDAYKYFWDSPNLPSSAWDYWTSTEPIREPAETPEWSVSFPIDGSTFIPTLGQHTLVVRLKDRNNIETECEFRVEVLPGPEALLEESILLVDDNEAYWPDERWKDFGETQDALWADILDGYAWEEFDTGPGYRETVPVWSIGNATTVIWLVDQDDTTIPPTALLECCTKLGNYLFSYVRAGGNLIILGRNPVYACGYWPGGTPDPALRGWQSNWNFDPASGSAPGDTTNFMWEVFGIKNMRLSSGMTVPFTAVWPCPECHEVFRDTIELGPQASHIYGVFESASYITALREDMDVRPLLSTAVRDTAGEWIDSRRGGNPNYIAVYVPGNERRGYAAFIGFPEVWFDHARIKTMIRALLDEFEEQTR